MHLTACYIVKNEAAKLERSLESLRGAVDEIVVVDTGSTDETRLVAEKHGARVFSFPWQDDFSAARNVSLSKAKGDWILVVDADEYFPDGMAKNLRQAIRRHGREKDLLLLVRRELDEDTGKVLLDSYVPRVLRRVNGLAYEGAIHEEPRHLGRIIDRMGAIPAEDVLMMHTGYSGTLSRAKGERNLALLKKELESGSPRDSIYRYLAETYAGLDDEEKALKYAWMDVKSGRKDFAFASSAYRILLRILGKRPEAYRQRRRAAEIAVRDFPELPEFHAEYAECLGYGMEYREAAAEDEKALSLYAGGSVRGLEPTTFNGETAKLIEERRAYWMDFCIEERGEASLREKAACGNWQGLWDAAIKATKAQGARLLFLLLRLVGDASEEARESVALAERLLPPKSAELWRLQEQGMPIDEAAVFPEEVDGEGDSPAEQLAREGEQAYRDGRTEQALNRATEAIQSDRYCGAALSLLCRLVRSLPAADVIQCLNAFYDVSSDAEFLIRVLAKNGLYEVCLYYDGKAGGGLLSRREKLMAAGAFPLAAREESRAAVRCYAMLILAARRTGHEDAVGEYLPREVYAADGAFYEEAQKQLIRLERVFPREDQ